MNSFDPQMLRALPVRFGGEVLHGDTAVAPYAGDASPYRVMPRAVLRPLSVEDCRTLVRFAADHALPLIPRAAGTSLAGQCVGEGLVVEMGCYMNRILDIDAANRRATVQPGVLRDTLNEALRPAGLMFAPDPSSTARCQIGGMLGNNAWGLHALRHGTTRDHVTALEAVLADGSTVRFGPSSAQALAAKRELPNLEGEIYRTVFDVIDRNRGRIARCYPTFRGVPNNAGYALDVIARMQPWERDGADFNLAPLLCGSEGTLALVTEVTVVALTAGVAHCSVLCAQFGSVEEALRAVAEILALRPSALELLDRSILEHARRHPEQHANCFWLRGDPGAVLLIECSGDTGDEMRQRRQAIRGLVVGGDGGNCCTAVDGPDMEKVWALRRAALAMLMESAGGLRALTGIEDSAVAVDALPAYYAEVKALLQIRGLRHCVYGPVGMGSLHIRPEMVLDSPEAIARYGRLIEDTAAITARFRGSFSCKHGDGRMRGRFLAATLGEEMIAPLRAVKRAFDPAGLFNPGKILDCPPLTADITLHPSL